MSMTDKTSEEICCTLLKSKNWDDKEHNWKNKPFYKTKYYSLFHMPLTIASAIKKADNNAKKHGVEWEDLPIMLSTEGTFVSDYFISLKEASDKVPMETISGAFYSVLKEGKSYSESYKLCQQATKQFEEKYGKKPEKAFYWYPICPKCNKEYGKIQVVTFFKIPQ